MIFWFVELAGAAPTTEVGALLELAPEPWYDTDVIEGLVFPAATSPVGADLGMVLFSGRVSPRIGVKGSTSRIVEAWDPDVASWLWRLEGRPGLRVVLGPTTGPAVFSVEGAVQLGAVWGGPGVGGSACLALRPSVWLGESSLRGWVAADFQVGGPDFTYGGPLVRIRHYRQHQGVALIVGGRVGRRDPVSK